uniref:HMG-Y-related protein A n=1 Tax=Oryza glumipatula TaxID=40148 RepID=A0A0E0AVL1_9ORYZ
MAAADEASKPPPLPPYPEMILAAIEGLNEKSGSNKSAISKFIEGKYGDLPPAHASLLTAHLARMKESGELIFLKNNYFRADAPDAPPKRGRGRPPKPRDPNAPPPPPKPSSPRPRGRPPKSKDPISDAIPKSRGRPPKKAKTAPAPPPATGDGSAPVKRGRGRPPKLVWPLMVATGVLVGGGGGSWYLCASWTANRRHGGQIIPEQEPQSKMEFSDLDGLGGGGGGASGGGCRHPARVRVCVGGGDGVCVAPGTSVAVVEVATVSALPSVLRCPSSPFAVPELAVALFPSVAPVLAMAPAGVGMCAVIGGVAVVAP